MLGAVQAAIVPSGRVLLGAELVDNLNTNVGGIWSNTINNTVEADGENGIKITYVDSNTQWVGLRKTFGAFTEDMVVGQAYLFTFEAKAVGSVSIRIQNGSGGNLSGVAVVSTNTFAPYRLTFTAVNTSSSLFQVYNLGAGDVLWLRNMSLKKVL